MSKEMALVVKKAAEPAKPVKKEKKELRIVRYFKEVRAELKKVVWPTRRNTLNLTAIVLSVTAIMSISWGFVWIGFFAKLFSWIISLSQVFGFR